VCVFENKDRVTCSERGWWLWGVRRCCSSRLGVTGWLTACLQLTVWLQS